MLTEEQIRLLERHSPEFRMRHVETSAPGELLNQDTFYWGTLKGVGKIYVQVVIDAFCSRAFAKVYTSNMPITAADPVYDRALLFYAALGVTVKTILGRSEHHPYQLLLALHDIEHRTTKVRSLRTNGFVERMNRTLLDEHFRIKGRGKWYESVEDIQADLDVFIEFTTSSAATRATGSTAERRRRRCARHSAGKSCHRSSRRRMKPPSPRGIIGVAGDPECRGITQPVHP